MNQSPTTYQKPEEIGRMQEMKLQELLQYLNKFSPWYKKMFTQNQIDLNRIKELKDLTLLPVTVI